LKSLELSSVEVLKSLPMSSLDLANYKSLELSNYLGKC
jgi:hypothetical protein